jgi:hypothetical protein
MAASPGVEARSNTEIDSRSTPPSPLSSLSSTPASPVVLPTSPQSIPVSLTSLPTSPPSLPLIAAILRALKEDIDLVREDASIPTDTHLLGLGLTATLSLVQTIATLSNPDVLTSLTEPSNEDTLRSTDLGDVPLIAYSLR